MAKGTILYRRRFHRVGARVVWVKHRRRPATPWVAWCGASLPLLAVVRTARFLEPRDVKACGHCFVRALTPDDKA